MASLLLWLLWVLLFGASGSSIASGTATATVRARAPRALHVLFTIDGRRVRADRSILLQRGELLVFSRGVTELRVRRLECRRDVHPIPLVRRSWRVPDLPTGLYELDGHGASFGFSYLVSVHSHAAPCPGP